MSDTVQHTITFVIPATNFHDLFLYDMNKETVERIRKGRLKGYRETSRVTRRFGIIMVREELLAMMMMMMMMGYWMRGYLQGIRISV